MGITWRMRPAYGSRIRPAYAHPVPSIPVARHPTPGVISRKNSRILNLLRVANKEGQSNHWLRDRDRNTAFRKRCEDSDLSPRMIRSAATALNHSATTSPCLLIA